MWLVKWDSAFNQWVNTLKVGNLCLSLSHYRILVLPLLLTHVITKKSYEMACTSIEGLQVSTGFVIPISRYWIAIVHSNCSFQCFTNAAQPCIKAVYRPYGFVWLFFASLRQRSCSINAVTKMYCCSERKTAFVQPFCSARCSANKSLKQRCFNIFCIIRVHIQVNFSAFHSTYHSAYRYTVKEDNEALFSENHLSLELKRL